FFPIPVTHAAIDETMPATIPSEILADWKAQGGTAADIKASLPAEYAAKCDGSFESACHWRRVYRISRFPQMETIMFNRRHNIGSIAIGFWVNVGTSDITDDHFEAKGALCLLKFQNYYSTYREILTKTDMCVKDPCISLDGKKVCFAMSRGRGQGFLLYEMAIDNPGSIKQLTFNPAGLTVSDFEPCYLPNGDIMFSSTRCFGTIDCGWQPTSNMFVMDSAGKYLRRLGFDQVHTFYPVLRGDGMVLYERWEYNDRDIANIMGLFSMYPDGCHQKEVFGNQTTWPMNLIHARPVPGNPSKYFAVASGHHGAYSGEVCVIDIFNNSNGPENIKMVSPVRETKTLDNNDVMAMGGVYRNSEYPYPLNDQWYLVSYRDVGQESFGRVSNTPYKIYLKHVDGKSRELLAWGTGSLHHPVVVAPWRSIWGDDPVQIAEQANYNDSMGSFTMQNVYKGAGMQGVQQGAAKTLRVIAIRYRVSGACDQGYAGMLSGAAPPGVIFSAPNINPPSLWGGSWDVKEVLGEAKIFEDGSAAFKVPARTPVYFQVLDSNGRSIASMRSWATLMPHETFACLGCHESKNESPDPGVNPMAGTPKPLETPLGVENRGFDFPTFVQPVLDKHCVSCHKANHASGFDFTGNLVYNSAAKKSFARSYASLMQGIGRSTGNRAINIATIFSQAPQMAPRSFGSIKSGMINNVLNGHNNVTITAREVKTLACWIDLEAVHSGSYDAYMSASDAQRYQQLEATAKKWYDIEAQNVKDLAAKQRVAVMRGQGGAIHAVAAAGRPGIGYVPARHVLVVSNVCRGTFALMDLTGKTISRMSLSRQTAGNLTLSLPASLGTGLYLARFHGVNGTQQAKIFIPR
ncbi:MAG: hypothetical protein JW768_15330, partial [Chitinispirillaceae bacterium]|nr:hypothetical protein [Chitinispirillaceae bacterium]